MDRISLQLQALETEGDRQTVHTNYRFALLQNVIQSTNKPGVGGKRSHRKTPRHRQEWRLVWAGQCPCSEAKQRALESLCHGPAKNLRT